MSQQRDREEKLEKWKNWNYEGPEKYPMEEEIQTPVMSVAKTYDDRIQFISRMKNASKGLTSLIPSRELIYSRKTYLVSCH